MKTFYIDFIDHLGRRWRAETNADNRLEAASELLEQTPFAVNIFSIMGVGNAV